MRPNTGEQQTLRKRRRSGSAGASVMNFFRRLVGVLALYIALLTLSIGGFLLAFTHAGLASVSATTGGRDPTLAPNVYWLVVVGLMALGMVLTCSKDDAQEGFDVAQFLGAVALLSFTGIGSAIIASNLSMVGTSLTCPYSGCWPRGYQELLTTFPVIVSSLAMIVMSFMQKSAWKIRAFVPVGVFLVLVLLQLAVWDSVVKPVLFAPPPI